MVTRNKKILMLAWRDMMHPEKGGAEIVTDIYLQGLSRKGYDVVLFSSRFKGSLVEEEYHGYKIIRNGGKLGVYIKGLLYATKNLSDYDLIIDQINTVPFFTPLTIPKDKRMVFIHQLCLNVWFYETPLPIAIVGNILERLYLKLYKNTKCLTVSESTKNDLIKYAKNIPENIFVLENQIDFSPLKHPKEKEKCFVFCGRLKKSKRVHDCIKALYYLNNPKVKLYIIGDGDSNYKKRLNRLAKKLNLSSQVVFTGKISLEERNEIMSKSLAILVTSVREGWGLIVTEANANGTVAITYDIEGLRDANKSGFITKSNNPKELTLCMNRLLNDKKLLVSKSKGSIDLALEHSDWNKNNRRLLQWIENR